MILFINQASEKIRSIKLAFEEMIYNRGICEDMIHYTGIWEDMTHNTCVWSDMIYNTAVWGDMIHNTDVWRDIYNTVFWWDITEVFGWILFILQVFVGIWAFEVIWFITHRLRKYDVSFWGDVIHKTRT